MLTKLTIRNFKQFRYEMSIEFTPITVLVGANNSGKSTVLQALSILQYCMEVTRKKNNGHFILENKTIGPEEFGALPVASPTDLWPDGRTGTPITIKAEFDNGSSVGFEVKLAYNRFAIKPAITGDVSQFLDHSKIRYVPIHTGLTLREEFLLEPARADRIRALQYGAVIRNLLWDLKVNAPQRWKLLKEILSRLYPASQIDVIFDSQVDRFIGSEYKDGVLSKALDVVVSGTGFQQVLQLFSGVLSKNSNIVLLDEPDAHLHARLQTDLMREFETLAQKENIQFVLTSHSPHLIASTAAGSLRAMIDGRTHSFATTPEQMDVLDTLGAFDRMEIIPLLRTKAVVFVENRDDRDFLELFARKLWGDLKTKKIWDGLSFLFTYQEPLSADVKRLARQVKDLLNSGSLGKLSDGRQARFLVIGDRDYRSVTTVKELKKETLAKSKTDAFKLDLQCEIWTRNEIENYLLDPIAIAKAVVSSLTDSTQIQRVEAIINQAFASGLLKLKPEVKNQIAHKLQQNDHSYRGDYTKTSREADKILQEEWGVGAALCDAKKLLSHIRAVLQEHKIKGRLTEAAIIENMTDVPPDVVKVLKLVQKLSSTKQKKTAKTVAPKV